jgi:hypothetical protein
MTPLVSVKQLGEASINSFALSFALSSLLEVDFDAMSGARCFRDWIDASRMWRGLMVKITLWNVSVLKEVSVPLSSGWYCILEIHPKIERSEHVMRSQWALLIWLFGRVMRRSGGALEI